MPTNRELAILTWFAAVAVFLMCRATGRNAIRRVVRALMTPKVVVTLLALLVYTCAGVVVLSGLHAWTWEQATASVFWLGGTGLVLYIRHDRAATDPHFFRRTAVSVLSLAVLIQFVTNLYTFGLIAELLTVPVVVLLGAALALAEARNEDARTRGCLRVLVYGAGLSLLVYSVARAAQDGLSAISMSTLRNLFVPGLLTIWLLPFIYALAVYATYDSLFISFRTLPGMSPHVIRYARQRALVRSGLRLSSIVRLAQAPWRLVLTNPASRSDVDRVVAHIRSGQPDILATSSAKQAELQQISSARLPGWEYALFAARLEAGATAVAYGYGGRDVSGRASELMGNRERVLRTIRRDDDCAIALAEELETALEPTKVEAAFGEPGQPGDEGRIVELAEQLLDTYGRMLQWSERSRAIRAQDKYAQLVQIHAELLDRPNEQIDEYIGRWTATVARLPTLIEQAEGSAEPIVLDLALTITIDSAILQRLHLEMERLNKAA